MAHQSPPLPVDERLTTLLAIEQRLEASFKEAEAGARARVEAARAAVVQAREAALRELEAQAAVEARDDAAAQELALQRLEAERNAALTRLSSVSDAQIDALARRALERVLGPRDGGDP